MASPVPPARLSVILARDAHTAVVLRRGPSKVVGTFGWNRSDDTFTAGQWLKGRIYEHSCDLSPDGKYFLYFAYNGQGHTETKGSWTAVSFAPYLKAISIWGNGSAWSGGGLFLDNRRYWVRHWGGHLLIRSTTYASKLTLVDAGALEELQPGITSHYLHRVRDGWERVQIPKSRCDIFEKSLPHGWRIRRLHGAGGPLMSDLARRGTQHDEYRLVSPDAEAAFPDWSWADWDHIQNRLVWASRGKLFAASVTPSGLGEAKELYDFNRAEFQPIEAPY